MGWRDFDVEDFFDDDAYALEAYVEGPPSDELVAGLEAELGYRFPASYVDFARLHNGGMPNYTCFPTSSATSWADDHIAITGLYSIGRTRPHSLGGSGGAIFMAREWGYPPIGFCIADCPSAGHDMVMFDYRQCGPDGEPAVVHVDEDDGYRITLLAPDFESFIRGLVHETEFDESADRREVELEMVDQGTLSPIVVRAMAATEHPEQTEAALRGLVRRIVETRGYFAIHADEDSRLLLDLLFWLYTRLAYPADFDDFYATSSPTYDPPSLTMMIVFGLDSQPYQLRVGGIAEDFVREWWADRLATGSLVASARGFHLLPGAADRLRQSLGL